MNKNNVGLNNRPAFLCVNVADYSTPRRSNETAVVRKTVVTCKIKHFHNILHSRPRRGKSTALKHFCKCFLLHVTTVNLKALCDPSKNVLQHFKTF